MPGGRTGLRGRERVRGGDRRRHEHKQERQRASTSGLRRPGLGLFQSDEGQGERLALRYVAPWGTRARKRGTQTCNRPRGICAQN